jgi:hypothetical protein
LKNYTTNWKQQARMENCKIPEKIKTRPRKQKLKKAIDEMARNLTGHMIKHHTHIRQPVIQKTTMQRQATTVGRTAGAFSISYLTEVSINNSTQQPFPRN